MTLDASAHPPVWMLYTEAARRLGFCGPVPVLVQGIGETGPVALA